VHLYRRHPVCFVNPRSHTHTLTLDKPDHILIVLDPLVHLDGLVRVIDRNEELLGLLVPALLLEQPRLLQIQTRHLRLAQVGGGDLERPLPLARLVVHLDALLGVVGAYVELLGHVALARRAEVVGDLLVVGERRVAVLLPLARVDGGVHGLQRLARLDVVVDGGVEELLRRQVVAPLTLQHNDLACVNGKHFNGEEKLVFSGVHFILNWHQ